MWFVQRKEHSMILLKLFNTNKRKLRVFLVILLALSTSISGLCWTFESRAAGTSYLRKKGLKIGIKREEEYPFSVQYAGVGTKRVYIDISKVHHKSTSNDEKKKVSFCLTYKDYNYLKTEQADAMIQTEYYKKYKDPGMDWFYTLIDGDTGKCLSTKNNPDVSMEVNYREGGGFGFSMTRCSNDEVISRDCSWDHVIEVEYPKDMKHVYLGIGGSNVLKYNKSNLDKKFFKGAVPFDKTTYYRKGKTNSRWILIDKL